MKYWIVCFLLCIVLSGCAQPKAEPNELTELQATACTSADEGNTCDTRLAELEIVTKEDCCSVLGKCC